MRVFHGLAAYRGGKDFLSKAIVALQGVQICTSDMPIGDLGLVVSGNHLEFYLTDCYSKFGEFQEVPDVYYLIENQEEVTLLSKNTVMKTDGTIITAYDYDECYYDDYQNGIDRETVYYSYTTKEIMIHSDRTSNDQDVTLEDFKNKSQNNYGEIFTEVTQIHDVWYNDEKSLPAAKKIAEFLGVGLIKVSANDSIFDLFQMDYL